MSFTKDIVKKLVPEFALRRARTVIAAQNRLKIQKACGRSKRVFLVPANRVEHYFHFLFDLALPLWCVIQNNPKTTLLIEEFGIFSQRIPQLFPGHVELIPKSDSVVDLRIPTEELIGLNPQFTHLESGAISSFKRHVCKTFSIDISQPQNKVLLIERLPPNSYFKNDAVKKGAGASRRSITNHHQLALAIQGEIESPFEFHNVPLENISFEKQIELFDQAALVIGQHGAGLANCVWMRPNSNVFEITHKPELKHFRVICELLEHQYLIQETDGSHVDVDVSKALKMLRKFKLNRTQF